MCIRDRIQITSRWTSYFINDFNLRPKITLFQTGNVESQSAFAAGAHLHTRGLPSKYKWVEDKESWWNYNSDYNSETGNYEYTDSTYIIDGGWVKLGSKREKDDYEEGGYEYTDSWSGDKMWFEIFGAYTVSRLRSGGNGRLNATVGASAVIYPDEEIAPRVYGAMDIDVTRNVKVIAEVFYDPYYVEWLDYVDNNNDSNTDLFFDVNAAKIKETEALKSVAINSAPSNLVFPSIIALFPLIFIFAPIRLSSETCINLFSKIFSLITDLLLALQSKTIICACKSVGKPG